MDVDPECPTRVSEAGPQAASRGGSLRGAAGLPAMALARGAPPTPRSRPPLTRYWDRHELLGTRHSPDGVPPIPCTPQKLLKGCRFSTFEPNHPAHGIPFALSSASAAAQAISEAPRRSTTSREAVCSAHRGKERAMNARIFTGKLAGAIALALSVAGCAAMLSRTHDEPSPEAVVGRTTAETAAVSSASGADHSADGGRANSLLEKLPLYFVQNRGQADPRA